VHPRAQVGFGHRDGRGVFEIELQLRGQHRRLRRAAQDGPAGVAEHAEAVLRTEYGLFGGIVAAGGSGVFVGAGAKEDEPVGRQPIEESNVFVPAVGLARRRRSRQFLCGVFHQGGHGGEVGHRQTDVLQRGLQPVDQGGAAVLPHRGQHHQDHGGLAPAQGHHRVEHGAHVQARVGQFAHDAVHQERAVFLHDLQEVELQRLPAEAFGGGQEDLRLGARHPRLRLGEAPELSEVQGEGVGGHPRQLLSPPVSGDLPGERLLQTREAFSFERFGDSFDHGIRRCGVQIDAVHRFSRNFRPKTALKRPNLARPDDGSTTTGGNNADLA
jgi:hypothetical protein